MALCDLKSLRHHAVFEWPASAQFCATAGRNASSLSTENAGVLASHRHEPKQRTQNRHWHDSADENCQFHCKTGNYHRPVRFQCG